MKSKCGYIVDTITKKRECPFCGQNFLKTYGKKIYVD